MDETVLKDNFKIHSDCNNFTTNALGRYPNNHMLIMIEKETTLVVLRPVVKIKSRSLEPLPGAHL